MPGIVGIINKNNDKRNKRDLRLMIDCMMHEPFYKSGTYVNNHLGLYAGWVSHKDSFSDCMPIFNEKKYLVLLFSGENFIDNDVSDELKNRDHEFEFSNASYLIHLYEDQGEKFLKQLNGWFSGILVDLQKGKMILFIDRYGMQRIYYYESKDAFYFSSEAKSLLKVRPELREIDIESLGQYFSFGCVMKNKTLFTNVFLLPGGSAWTFYNGHVKKDFYFKPSEWENQTILDKEIFYEKLRDLFRNIMPRYFNSKQPIGMSLTGGLDTRLIMAYVDDLHGKLPCYTYGGMYNECFDVKIARKIADKCKQAHQVLRLDEEFLVNFSSLAEKTIYITDGYGDVCVSHEAYLNKLAREIAPIRMTGNYGSEMLRSANYIKANPPDERLFHPDFISFIHLAEKTYADANDENQLSFAVFKLIPWFMYGRLAPAQSQVTLRTPYMDNDLVSLMYQAPIEATLSNEISLRLISDGNSELSHIITDRGIGGNSNYIYSKCIRLYREFLFKAEYQFNEGMPDWLVKMNRTLSPLKLEKIFLGNHKIEHYRKWFRDALSGYINEILLDDRTANRSYYNKGYLNKIVNEHINGNRNYTNEINKTLTVELINRLLIEQKY